ncbi:MAG: hypothetical protein JWO68_4137 [Actinomycetia bacterium]|nr:hypothetical protein [Actinomycetes bacterium]
MISRNDIETRTAGRAASRASSTAMIVVALVVALAFTALWIGELISPPGTLRLPHHALAAGLSHHDAQDAVT